MAAKIAVKSASVVAGGSGGSNGTQVVTAVGGTVVPGGVPATHTVTISGGAITNVISSTPGNYVVPPPNPVRVTGAGIVGATLAHQYDANGNDEFFQ